MLIIKTLKFFNFIYFSQKVLIKQEHFDFTVYLIECLINCKINFSFIVYRLSFNFQIMGLIKLLYWTPLMYTRPVQSLFLKKQNTTYMAPEGSKEPFLYYSFLGLTKT